jgi:hypothetical protein
MAQVSPAFRPATSAHAAISSAAGDVRRRLSYSALPAARLCSCGAIPVAQVQGTPMNIHLSIGPLLALIAGILILVMPRLLNYIVAIYLILVGLIGLFGLGINLR